MEKYTIYVFDGPMMYKVWTDLLGIKDILKTTKYSVLRPSTYQTASLIEGEVVWTDVKDKTVGEIVEGIFAPTGQYSRI